MIPHHPNYQELLDVCAKYVRQEQGDTNYELAYRWVEIHWDDAVRVAGSVRILEETWNRAFYSHGIFNMQKVVQAIEEYRNRLNLFRLRQIETFSSVDEEPTGGLWAGFFEALKPKERDVSPYVATSKALHLLAPSFFVPFDTAIAKKYGCNIDQPRGFIQFQHYMAELACHVLDTFVAEHGGDHEMARAMICGSLYMERTGSHYMKTLAKLLDEYNWIERLDKTVTNQVRKPSAKSKLSIPLLALETARRHFSNQPFSGQSLYRSMVEDHGYIKPGSFLPADWTVNQISGYEFDQVGSRWHKRYRIFFKREDGMLEIYNPSVHGGWTRVNDRCQRID